MLKTRVMPCLLLRDEALVKTVKFKDPEYIGDPINAVRIYNKMEVDELVFLDITATLEDKKPSFKILEEIASECFMPLAYGGGIRTLDDVKQIFSIGFEKVVINSYAPDNPNFLRECADQFGSQSILISIDVKKKMFGRYEVFTRSASKGLGMGPVEYAQKMEQAGAGEIFLASIDRDGTQNGYDIELIQSVTEAVSVPVIVCGGAGKVEDFGEAVHEGGASACAAGSMLVYYGPHRAVLINFPDKADLERVLG